MTNFFKRPFQSYASNSFKNLEEKCIGNILKQTPSTKTYLAYPSNEGKDYFIQSLLDKNLSVFGIRFITIQQFIHLSLKICYQKDLLFPSHYELMFFLEEKITCLINSNDTNANLLKEYIDGKLEKIISLSSNLSHVFLEYMLYGKNALPKWLEKGGWQQTLFEQVSKKWTCITKAIENIPPPPFPITLHLFGVDQIPPLYLECMEKLSSHFSFYFYFLSPSPLFWGDLISRKKGAYLDKILQKKGVCLEQRLDLLNFSKQSHPLLSHFSDAAKPLYNYLLEQNYEDDYVDIEMTSDLTYVQKSILYQVKPVCPPFEDGSLTLHKCPSLFREIEVVLSNILTTLKNHPHLNPKDIVILAPDIDIYFPFIAYHFANNNFPFAYTISNLKKIRHSESLNAIYQLFSLIDSRFEKDEVIKLFKSPFFQKKSQIDKEEIDILEKIILHTGIRWGFDSKSKEYALENSSAHPFGLFEKGFSHILDLLTCKDSPIEFSIAESIGDIIFLVKSLYRDTFFFKEEKKTLRDWIDKTMDLSNKYLTIEEEGEFFFKELKKISTLSKHSDFLYSFQSFKRIYSEIFFAKGAIEKTYSKPFLTFSSIENSPPISKVLFFIGLDEESFPKKETIRSLNELISYPNYDIKPSHCKKARYYLLKAITSCSTSISFSYTSNSPLDGRERNLSPLIEEMRHALCLKKPFEHPFIPYSLKYFTKNHVLEKNYNLYISSKEPFSPPFSFEKETKEEEKNKTITCKQLHTLTKSPSQFFYNFSANLYENKNFSPTVFDDSEFILSYLDKAIIKRMKVKEQTPCFKELMSINKLPGGIFEKAATKELSDEIFLEKELYKLHFGKINPYFSFILDPHIKKSFQKDLVTFFPAITINAFNKNYTIKGELLNLTEKGLVCLKKPSPSEKWKFLPYLILLSHLNSDIATNIYYIVAGEIEYFDKEKLKPLLIPLLSYYEKALENISPLVPEAIDEYLDKNSFIFSSLKEKLLAKFKDPYLEKGQTADYSHFEEELIALSSVLKGDQNARV
jgi:exonuclease V gamma subunit